MKKANILPSLVASMIFSLAFISCDDKDDDMVPAVEMPGTAPEVSFTALTSDNKILMFEARSLSTPTSSIDISGLASGEMIVSIDYRPATGQLYALSSMSRLYHINENSGAATALGTGSFTPAFQGANPSLDFNPTVDRVRLVTESGQNLRLHPESINGGMNPRIGAVAYSNSFSGTTMTTLFDIDFEQDKLYKQVPPNDGGLEEVGSLGVDFEGIGDMDLNPDNSVALAVNRKDDESRLYTIDLSTGKAMWVGTFTQPVVSIAFKTNTLTKIL